MLKYSLYLTNITKIKWALDFEPNIKAMKKLQNVICSN